MARKPRAQGGHKTVPGGGGEGYGYLAPGGGEAQEKLRAAAPRKGELGTRCPGLSPFPEGCMRNQCRARPSLQAQEWALSLLGGGTRIRGGVEAAPPSGRVRMQQRQHNDGGQGKGQEGRLSSQEAQGPPRSPMGREQPPGGEMLGEPPAPFQSRDKGWRL